MNTVCLLLLGTLFANGVNSMTKEPSLVEPITKGQSEQSPKFAPKSEDHPRSIMGVTSWTELDDPDNPPPDKP